ncbi:MAG: cysteine desulfurase family protein [Anaerolineales bacterium]
MRPESVYLDFAATTPVDRRVLDRMTPYFEDAFGNPSSIHGWGQQAEAALEEARATVASVLGSAPEEVLFTSGGSESDNLALRGAAFAERERRGATHILTTPVEHDAVLRTAEQLERVHGFVLEVLPVDGHGRVSPEELAQRIRPDTAVVSVIYANNEIGTINPIADLAAVCRARGVPFHTDAVQAGSQLPVHVGKLGVDLMSLGAHKFYGPKGVGVLYVRRGTRLVPAQTGGSHERGLRAGTPNVPLIIGLAAALEIVDEEREAHNGRFARHRNRILTEVIDTVPQARATGHPTERLPNHASFVFHELDGNQLLAALDLAGYAVSSGSACKTGDPEPSQVLLALGLPPAWALGSLRVTVGRDTSEAAVDGFLKALPPIVDRLRRAAVS